MEKKTINIKKMNERATIPTYGSESSAGADLYACMQDDVVLQPGETKLMRTGIAIEIPPGYAGFIYARSGLATKCGLAPANKVGVVDSDYRGELLVSLYNHSNEARTVASGERIAQLVITPVLMVYFNEVEKLGETRRGAGGFGSTGSK